MEAGPRGVDGDWRGEGEEEGVEDRASEVLIQRSISPDSRVPGFMQYAHV